MEQNEELTPCQKLDYKEGDIFEVARSNVFNLGQRIILVHDDNTDMPKFKLEGDTFPGWEYLDFVKKINIVEELQTQTKELIDLTNSVKEHGPVEQSATPEGWLYRINPDSPNSFWSFTQDATAAEGYRRAENVQIIRIGGGAVEQSAMVVLPQALSKSDAIAECGEYGGAMARGYAAYERQLKRLNPCLAFAASTPEPASPWISVEDRLPEIGERVIGFTGEVEEVTYWASNPGVHGGEDGFCDLFENDVEVSHWMPLPAAPEQPAKEMNK